MKIKMLDAENFLSFKKLEYVFPESGLVFIGGKKIDSYISSSNGAGKSAFIEALCWGLFGNTIRNAGADDVVNRDKGENCYVSILFEDDSGQEYLVYRSRKDSNHGNNLTLFKGNDELSFSGMKETQEQIDRVLGMNWQVFSSAVVFGEKAQRFSQATDKEKKEIFEDILALYSYSEAQAEVKKTLKDILSDYYGCESDLKSKNELKDSIEDELDELQEKLEQAKEEGKKADSEIKKLQTEIKKWNDEKNVVEKELKNLENDTKDLLEDKNDIHAEIQKLEKDKIKDLEEAENSLKTAQLELKGIDSDINRIGMAIKDLVNLDEGSFCPTCGRKVTEKSVEDVKKRYKEDLKPLLLKQKKWNEEVVKFNKEKEDKKVKWDKKIDELIKAEDELLDAVEDFEKEKKGFEDKIRRFEDDIKDNKREIKGLEDKKDLAEGYAQEAIDKKKEGLKKVENGIKDIKKAMKKLEIDIPYYEFWVEGFGNKGIKSFLIDEVVPVLNNKVSEFASALMDDSVQVQFDTQSKLKSGEYREKFDVKMVVGDEEINYSSFSAGEKRKIDVAILLALQNLIFQRSASGCNLVVFDEVFDALDRVGIERVVNLLSEESKEKSIFVISHIQELQDYFDKVIIVKNKNGISELEA